LGREERLRTVISGMETRRIAEVMLLPRGKAGFAEKIKLNSLPGSVNVNRRKILSWGDILHVFTFDG
jgi:hypothetical protein